MNDHPRVINLSPRDSMKLAQALIHAEMRPTAEAQRRAHRLRTLNQLDAEAADRYRPHAVVKKVFGHCEGREFCMVCYADECKAKPEPWAGVLKDLRAKGYGSAPEQRVTATRGHMFGLGRYWLAFGSTRSQVVAPQATERGRQVRTHSERRRERMRRRQLPWWAYERGILRGVVRAVGLGVVLGLVVVLWAAFSL